MTEIKLSITSVFGFRRKNLWKDALTIFLNLSSLV